LPSTTSRKKQDQGYSLLDNELTNNITTRATIEASHIPHKFFFLNPLAKQLATTRWASKPQSATKPPPPKPNWGKALVWLHVCLPKTERQTLHDRQPPPQLPFRLRRNKFLQQHILRLQLCVSGTKLTRGSQPRAASQALAHRRWSLGSASLLRQEQSSLRQRRPHMCSELFNQSRRRDGVENRSVEKS